MSRHLYDIEKLMHNDSAKKALQNPELYNAIVNHRRKYTALQEVDYDKHIPAFIQFVPPGEQLSAWEADYKLMQENMIYGETLDFADLIKKLSELQSQINSTMELKTGYKKTDIGVITTTFAESRLESSFSWLYPGVEIKTKINNIITLL